MGIAACAAGAMSGAFIGLRALAAARQSLRVRLVTAPVILTAALLGAFFYGAVGAAIGMAIANWAAAVLTWRSFAKTVARRTSSAEVNLTLTQNGIDLTPSRVSG
jgi:hypothetical protein